MEEIAEENWTPCSNKIFGCRFRVYLAIPDNIYCFPCSVQHLNIMPHQYQGVDFRGIERGPFFLRATPLATLPNN